MQNHDMNKTRWEHRPGNACLLGEVRRGILNKVTSKQKGVGQNSPAREGGMFQEQQVPPHSIRLQRRCPEGRGR